MDELVDGEKEVTIENLKTSYFASVHINLSICSLSQNQVNYMEQRHCALFNAMRMHWLLTFSASTCCVCGVF